MVEFRVFTEAKPNEYEECLVGTAFLLVLIKIIAQSCDCFQLPLHNVVAFLWALSIYHYNEGYIWFVIIFTILLTSGCLW